MKTPAPTPTKNATRTSANGMRCRYLRIERIRRRRDDRDGRAPDARAAPESPDAPASEEAIAGSPRPT